MEKKTCDRCHKTYTVDKFYKTKAPTEKYPDGVLPICKTCLENTFKATEPASFMPILYALDIPWLPSEYKAIYSKHAKKSNPNSIALLGKYIMKMKLIQYNSYGFMDTDAAQAKYEQEAFYDPIDNYKYDVSLTVPTSYLSSGGGGDILGLEGITPADDRPAEDLIAIAGLTEEDFCELQDKSEELTTEELKYLILKWGRAYNKSQLLRLEKMYMEMCEDYDIRTTTQKDYLRKFCVASLRYDECLEAQDFESAKKASAMYTNINKEAGFQPILNQGLNNDNLDAVGVIVRMCEEMGPIPVYNIETNPDIVDITIKDLKLFNRRLVDSDDTIMERFAIAKEELAAQDALVANGVLDDEAAEDDAASFGFDTSVYDEVDKRLDNETF